MLSEPAAVGLLLETAEISATSCTATQMAAARKITKLAGYLPLYVLCPSDNVTASRKSILRDLYTPFRRFRNSLALN